VLAAALAPREAAAQAANQPFHAPCHAFFDPTLNLFGIIPSFRIETPERRHATAVAIIDRARPAQHAVSKRSPTPSAKPVDGCRPITGIDRQKPL